MKAEVNRLVNKHVIIVKKNETEARLWPEYIKPVRMKKRHIKTMIFYSK